MPPVAPVHPVPIDMQRIEARLRFDPAGRSARADVDVTFRLNRPGAPAFDLRQDLRAAELHLDGRPLDADRIGHRDLGGGDGADMRVLDQHLDAGVPHVLELHYPLGAPAAREAKGIEWPDGGVLFDLWMSDLHPGRYLESWLPAGLCDDTFSLGVEVEVAGGGHSVLTNGLAAGSAAGWRIDFPETFTSLSPMLVVAPTDGLQLRRRVVDLPGRRGAVSVEVCALAGVDVDLAASEADIAGWLAGLAGRYGPYVHGERFTAVIWAPGRGMEYDGATTASVGALEHEVFHSWFGRGVKPATAADGWIDEALATWATSSRRGEEGRFAEIDLGLDEDPMVLAPASPWCRHTPVEAYAGGSRLMAGLAHLIGGAPRLRSALADWYRAEAGGAVSTEGLRRHLTTWSGVDVGPWFDRYVRGRA